MGTLSGHLLPGAAFTAAGLWHLLNTAASFRLSGPSTFSSRLWFPSPFLKHLELLLLLLLSLLAAALQLLSAPSLVDLEHATMFLHLAIYSASALAADLLSSPSAIVGALAASAFAQELLLLHFHSIDHSSLESHYHRLLEIVVTVCFISTATTVGFPASYMAAVVRSAAVALQGLWFIWTGVVLWGPVRLMPEGCSEEGVGVVACAAAGAAARAAAMANLQFSWMVAFVSVLTVVVCLLPGGKGVEYRRLCPAGGSSGDGDVVKMAHAPV
ncbi:hypothetical protein AXF42_Ash018847 [Apostasia shenzhenica]|uniref:Transmembrane protein 45B n=1 Tax=Apostasia shenzhenica TaxID=1088818 RepID=A0A2I0B1A5_9ASPA|nr:hypothetical protein AXF42_Ash018847 [Apostasia shenzhenica]